MSDKEIVSTEEKDKEEVLPAYYSISSAKKKAFLIAYGKCGMVRTAARNAGVADHSHYLWMDKDPQYRQAFEDIQPRVTQMLRDHIISRATAAKKPSDLLAMFEMKRRDPQYRDNFQIQVNSSGPTQVNFNISAPKLPNNPNDAPADDSEPQGFFPEPDDEDS